MAKAQPKRHYPELRREDLLESLRQIRHLINFLGGEGYLKMMQEHKQTTVFHGSKYLNFVELRNRLKTFADNIFNAEENLRYIISWNMLTNDIYTLWLVNENLEQKAKEAGINIEDEKAVNDFKDLLVDEVRKTRNKEIQNVLQLEKNIKKYCEQAADETKYFGDLELKPYKDNMQEGTPATKEEAKAKAKAGEKAAKEEAKTAFTQESKEHMLETCYRLKSWRLRNNMTEYQLGQLIGARYEVVKNIEAGNGQSAMQYYQAYIDYVEKHS